jgi:hypothetical protein
VTFRHDDDPLPVYDPDYGDRVRITDPASPWFGWTGTVIGRFVRPVDGAQMRDVVLPGQSGPVTRSFPVRSLLVTRLA